MKSNEMTVKIEDQADSLLEQKYMELGKAYYEGGFEDPLPQLLSLFDEITRIRTIYYGEPGIKLSKKCSGCGKEIKENAQFCSYCGQKL